MYNTIQQYDACIQFNTYNIFIIFYFYKYMLHKYTLKYSNNNMYNNICNI